MEKKIRTKVFLGQTAYLCGTVVASHTCTKVHYSSFRLQDQISLTFALIKIS